MRGEFELTKGRYNQLRKIARKTFKQSGLCENKADMFALAKMLNLQTIKMSELSKEEILLHNIDTNRAVTLIYYGQKQIYYNPDTSNVQGLLAHEIAHHILNHKQDDTQAEQEADALAHMLMYPENRTHQLIFMSCIVGSFLFFILCSFAIGYHTKPKIENQVYITSSGDKYHVNRICAGENATPVSIETAKDLQKTPCLQCTGAN